MISFYMFQKNLRALFKMAKPDSIQLKVSHRKIVYVVTIERTGDEYIRPKFYYPKSSKLLKKGVPLITQTCEFCESVVIASICVNPNCVGSKKKTTPISE